MYTGPHRVLLKNGRFTYIVNSHRGRNRDIQINVNDIKRMAIPDTTGWRINQDILRNALINLGLEEDALIPDILIDFTCLNDLVSDLIRTGDPRYFVVPIWPSAPWYHALTRVLTCDAVELPDTHDLFINASGYPLGRFAFRFWF